MMALQLVRSRRVTLRLPCRSDSTAERFTDTHWRTRHVAWWLALFSGSMLLVGGTCRAADDAADPTAAIQAAHPDPTVAALLRKVEQQVAEGHDTAPPKDNAMETWQQVIDRMPYPVSADFARALADFIDEVKKQSVQQLAAKNQVAAYDLLTFADLASGQLKYFHGPAPSAPAPAETLMQPVPQQTPASPTAERDAGAGQVQASIESALAVDALHPPDRSGGDPDVAKESPARTTDTGVRNSAAAPVPPDTHPSVVQAPTTKSPVTPVTEASDAQAPTTQEPAAPPPVTHAPVTHAPVTHRPVGQAVVAQEQAAQAPAAQTPVAPAPIAQAQSPITHGSVPQAPFRQALIEPAPVPREPAAPEPATHSGSAEAASQAALYVSRGDQMLAIKDVSAARKFFEYGADAGSSVAAADLAKTYDPLFLSRLGVAGLQPDLDKAKQWYARAAALGDTDSQARLRMLSEQVSR